MNETGSYGGYPLAFKDTSVSQTSMYSSLLYSGHTGLSVELGGRLNTDSRYGSNYTYTFNPAWLIDHTLEAIRQHRQRIQGPDPLSTLFALRRPQPSTRESRNSYEGGIQFSNTVFNTRATYFHRKTQDGIDYNYFTNLYYNYDEEKGNGIEWEGSVKFARIWSLTANYTWLKMQEQTQSHVSYDDTTYTTMRCGYPSIRSTLRWASGRSAAFLSA